MNNKTLLLTLSFTLGTLFTNAQSLPGFQWGEGMGTPDLSWTAQVGAKTYPEGKIFQAADYGLKNDSTRLSTAALQKAIDECHRSGGGTVEVAPGYYRIGAIYLKSNVNLHLNQGTTLIASEDIDLYPEMRSRVAGIEMVWPSAVINILDAENAAISGAGTLDCRGKIFWDKYWTMRKDYEKRKLRWIVDYDCKRVRGMLISNSRHITLKDFTLMRTGFWGCQVLYSDQCTLNGLKINNNVGGHGPSTDGIDIDSSTNILIENCEVDCNDDNICLKAGRDADGLRVNRPTENIIVRGCIARKGAGLITCGSETSGCIRNVLGYNLQAYGTSSTLRLKSAMNRGGTVENIYMTQVTADHVRHVLAADLNWNPSYSYSTLPAEYEGKETYARRITDNGFVQTISRYRARNCKGCPLRCRCHRSRSERIVQVNHRLRKIKEREREKLLSDEGLKYRSQRPQDVEAVFGNLKNNKHFKRFHLRGLKKVEIEFGLLAIAHNLAKVAS